MFGASAIKIFFCRPTRLSANKPNLSLLLSKQQITTDLSPFLHRIQMNLNEPLFQKKNWLSTDLNRLKNTMLFGMPITVSKNLYLRPEKKIISTIPFSFLLVIM